MAISKKKNTWLLAPLFGILIFSLLYIIAIFYYPGGSQVDKNLIGFSWTQNYWCNLLNETAISGQYNPARPVGLTAMVVLCLSLALFWYIFPQRISLSSIHKRIIQFSGIISMSVGFLLFTNLHDMVINLASFFGVIALIGTIIGLYKLKWVKLFWFGIFNLVLVAVNNILYYRTDLMFYLPVVQKISFLSFLIWFCWISIRLYQRFPVRIVR